MNISHYRMRWSCAEWFVLTAVGEGFASSCSESSTSSRSSSKSELLIELVCDMFVTEDALEGNEHW